MVFFNRHIPWVLSFSIAMLLVGSYQVLFGAPPDFPRGSVVSIVRGAPAPSVVDQLAAAHIIKHPSLLLLALRISGSTSRVQAGAYRFESPQSMFIVAYRIVAGAYDLPPARVTFPEGSTVREMAIDVAKALPEVSAADFLKEAQPYEGYLFPDTYQFPPSSDAASVVSSMRVNFNTKIATLSDEIAASGRSLSDIVIMASLLEREARRSETKRMVAGILFNRLKLGMPLQVDAVFGYIFGRDTYSPSLKDLTVDSLYNTYTHKGLPPGPICNPGLESLEAALNPTQTKYLYYLTGTDGMMHYSTTYAGHQANRRKYMHR